MTLTSAAETLNRFAGRAIIIDRVEVGDDCVVVTLRPAGHIGATSRHLAISVGECAGLSIEELKDGHPTLLRIATAKRKDPAAEKWRRIGASEHNNPEPAA